MHKIFIVEDDKVISEAMITYLTAWGYQVKGVKNFNNVIEEFLQYDPQLILLDIALPFFNGYYWCGEIRKISKVPIVFISSNSDSMNLVMAINMGGDDFIAKPFDMTVLVAKIQALLRRTYDFQGQATNVLEHKGVILNVNENALYYKESKLELTKNEFKILQLLLQNPGKVVSREEIMKKLWDSDCFVDDNTLTVNMTRLRKKIEEIGVKQFITTKKGTGYLIGD
ncbi:response regulator transcription factor [Anaeromicropila populeti]|uniref:Stage 0 sporulation protein A homolog n=1 Tax=Anaeromicropila populeti TaxID=37658 RepID=A0A1I6J3D4_9FIRM|nr:response regulator transcription factor [Anaeromicropila populeti]SFR73000.1 DNA-binding response regulator, OmpR family, contains REC and winged-helix (wHTH) domain [Anaeromicropila populeti]